MNSTKIYPCGCDAVRVAAGLCDVHNTDGAMRAPRPVVPICALHVRGVVDWFEAASDAAQIRANDARATEDSHTHAEQQAIADTWSAAAEGLFKLLVGQHERRIGVLELGEAFWPNLNARRSYLLTKDVELGLNSAEAATLASLEGVCRAREALFYALAKVRGTAGATLQALFVEVSRTNTWPTRMNQLTDPCREWLVDQLDELEIKRTREGELSPNDAAKFDKLSRALGTSPDPDAPTGKIMLGVSFERVLADGTRERVDPSDLRITVAGDDSQQAYELRAAVDRG